MAIKKTKAKSDWVANATWKQAPKGPTTKLQRIINMQLDTVVRDDDGNVLAPGVTVCMQGLHGIGKTQATIAEYERNGVTAVAYSAAVMLPADLYLMLPTVDKAIAAGATDEELLAKDDTSAELRNAAKAAVKSMTYVLETHFSERLNHAGPWALILDEANRVQRVMLAAFMEITVDGSILGTVLPNLVGVTLLRNPAGEGYLGISTGDLAFESRFPTFGITDKDIAWREYLAQKFVSVDLKKFFESYRGLDATTRRVFCPRVVDHVLEVTLADLPPGVALPILPSRRQKIVNADGEDITEKVLRLTAESIGKVYQSIDSFTGLVTRCRDISLLKGWNLREVGPHGIGKTTTAKQFGAEKGIETAVLSASMADPSSFVQLVPMKGKVQPILADRVNFKGKPGLLVLDEFSLADKTVKPQMLEVTGPTRSLASIPLNVVAVWALDNPNRFGAIQYSGRTADEAMVSRFVLNLEVTEDDYPWRNALESRFGEEQFLPFAQWRSQDLNTEEKPLISPRTLAIMATLHKYKLDVDEALPFLGKDRVPIRTHSLKARLANRKVLGLDAIISESKSLLAILNDPKASDQEKVEIEDAVVTSLQKAEVKELEPHADVLVEFISALPPHCRTDVINAAQSERTESADKKLHFWGEVFGRTLKT